MSLNAKNVKSEPKGFRQPPLEAGGYPGRLVQIIDLGVQKQRPYKGVEKDPIQMIYTTYELTDEFCVTEEGEIQEDKPRWMSEDFAFHNLDADLATSTKRYLALDPNVEKEGDWEALLGSPVMVNITHNPGTGKHEGKVFNNIRDTATMRKKEADKVEELKNPTKFFSLDDPDMDVFMALPKWLQDRIKENLNFAGSDLEDAIRHYKAPEKENQPDEEVKKDEKVNDEEDW